MRRRFARLGVVVLLSMGLVALVPLMTPSAFAADCATNSLTVSVACVNVPGVASVTNAPSEPKTTGCVQADCATLTRSGPTLHKAQPNKPKPKPEVKPAPARNPEASPRGAVLGFRLERFERESSDFYTGSFEETLPLESEGWRNGIYRNPTPVIVEAPEPTSSFWAPLTGPAALTSFVLGALLLVSAFSFKRLMLN